MGVGTSQCSDRQGPGSAEFWAQQGRRSRRWMNSAERGSISDAFKGLVGGSAQASADCRRNWTTSLIPRSSGIGTHATSVESADAARSVWGGGRYKLARSAMREQGRSKTGIASLRHVKTVARGCSCSYWRSARTPGCHCLLRRSWPEEAPVPGP